MLRHELQRPRAVVLVAGLVVVSVISGYIIHGIHASSGSVLLVGNQTVEVFQDPTAAGAADAFRYTAITTGTASHISMYVELGTTATGMMLGIYSNNGSTPGSLLASGSASTLKPGAWNTVTLTSFPTITAGTVYWIAYLGTGGGSIIAEAKNSGMCSQIDSQLGLTTLPAIWSTGSIWSPCNASLYVMSAPLGDLNGDNRVNVFDLSILLSHWGAGYAAADFNHDGIVNVFDLSILLSNWTG